MSNTSITTSLGVAAALLAGIAQADVVVSYGASEFSIEKPCALSGNIGLGYASKYASRGLVLQDADTDNVFPMQAVGQFALCKKNALVGGISYTRFASNDSAIKNPKGSLSDEGSGIIEFAHHFSDRTVLAAGYQFVHGGLPGSFNYHGKGEQRDFPMFDSNRSEEHSFVVDFHHEFCNGFFWDSRVQYVVRWTDGWWFANTIGYKRQLCEKAELVASATWHASVNYFDSHLANSNGTQGYSLQLAVPTMVAEHVRVTPYVGVNFIGNGAEAANDKAGTDIYRDVTFVAGVGASYVF